MGPLPTCPGRQGRGKVDSLSNWSFLHGPSRVGMGPSS